MNRLFSFVGRLGICVSAAVLAGQMPVAATGASGSDMIFGGLGAQHPRTTLLQIYDQDRDSVGHGGYHQLFAHFGIDRTDLAQTVHGTVNSANHNIWSVGRTPHSGQDIRFTAGGRTVFFMRPLFTWGDNISYPALIGHRHSDGAWFAVLDSCGNIAIMRSNMTPSIHAQATPAPTSTVINISQSQSQSQSQAQAQAQAPAQVQTSTPSSQPAPATTQFPAKSSTFQTESLASSTSNSNAAASASASGATSTTGAAAEAPVATTAPTAAPAGAAAPLPATGGASAGIVGLTGLLLAFRYYRLSRNGLARALMRR